MTYQPTQLIIKRDPHNAPGRVVHAPTGEPLQWRALGSFVRLPDAQHDARIISVHYNAQGVIIAAVYVDALGRGVNVWHWRHGWSYVQRKAGKAAVNVETLRDLIYADQPELEVEPDTSLDARLAILSKSELAIVGSVELRTAQQVSQITRDAQSRALHALNERRSA
jgi:hypothetical protein